MQKKLAAASLGVVAIVGAVASQLPTVASQTNATRSPVTIPKFIEMDPSEYVSSWDSAGVEFHTPLGTYCHMEAPAEDKQTVLCGYDSREFNAVQLTTGQYANQVKATQPLTAQHGDVEVLHVGQLLRLKDAECQVNLDQSVSCTLGKNGFSISKNGLVL
ncbi:hypothetical protein QVA66_06245 [Staphylococcus chromogenes]|nr:hypothetical protein [Staphylococcus chromogenes]